MIALEQLDDNWSQKQYYILVGSVREKHRPLTLSLTPQNSYKQGLSRQMVRV